MKTKWEESGEQKEVTSPLSLIITAFGRVEDVRKTVTPQLRTDKGDSTLVLVDLGCGKNRLGATALAQVYKQLGDKPADVDSPELLKGFFLLPYSLWSVMKKCWLTMIVVTAVCM